MLYHRRPQVILQVNSASASLRPPGNAVVGSGNLFGGGGFLPGPAALSVFTPQTLLFCVAILLLSVLFYDPSFVPLIMSSNRHSESSDQKPFLLPLSIQPYMRVSSVCKSTWGRAAFASAVLILPYWPHRRGTCSWSIAALPPSFRVNKAIVEFSLGQICPGAF